MLFSYTIGPYQNIDSQLEYEAASGVLIWGMPYMRVANNMINQPPLGFFIDALFFGIFGLSFEVGVSIITLFGLGCTLLVYKLGRDLYGKSTGLFAATIFALTPWHIVLSRSFLIDTQCLFFSLLFVLVGIIAIRRDSIMLFMVSGTLFAVALLTKLFAVFALIPLSVFYLYHRQKKLNRASTLAAYFLPAILIFFLWYQIISGRGILSAISHDDFSNYYSLGVAPTAFFVGNFLIDALGILFVIAAVLSLLVSFLGRKTFAPILPFDMMCLATCVAVISLNIFLAIGLNLGAPYFNPIKYDYQILPFLSLLAASLIKKTLVLFPSAKSKKINKVLSFVALAGLVLLTIAMFLNMNYMHTKSTWDHILFKVEIERNVGYSLVNLSPTIESSALMGVQYLGFALIVLGLVLAIAQAKKNKVIWLRKVMNRPVF